MNQKYVLTIIFLLGLSACVTIPKETAILSKTLGQDLEKLHKSHRSSVEIYFNKVKEDINYFIDEIYAPFIIHYVVKNELKSYQDGDSSIFKTLELAAKKEDKEVSEISVNEMKDFISAAQQQINDKRNELLLPVKKKEEDLISSIDNSYQSIIYANSTITGYLESIRKVKEAQQEALAKVGLAGIDTTVVNSLVRLSDLINEAIEEGGKIDVKSDNAYKSLEAITNKIKELTTKK